MTFSDGARAKVCLCGVWRVEFVAELPDHMFNAYAQKALDMLEAEGTAPITEEEPS